jgi:hypothetical protein
MSNSLQGATVAVPFGRGFQNSQSVGSSPYPGKLGNAAAGNPRFKLLIPFAITLPEESMNLPALFLRVPGTISHWTVPVIEILVNCALVPFISPPNHGRRGARVRRSISLGDHVDLVSVSRGTKGTGGWRRSRAYISLSFFCSGAELASCHDVSIVARVVPR